MASFYCTPKEIGSLCILRKKTPPFKQSLLLQPPEHSTQAPRCLGTERLSVELASSSPAADLLSVWGIPAPGPNPQASLWRPQHTHSFFCLDNDPWLRDLHRIGRKGKKRRREREKKKEKDFIYIPGCKSCSLWNRPKKKLSILPQKRFNNVKQNCVPTSPWLLEKELVIDNTLHLQVESYSPCCTCLYSPGSHSSSLGFSADPLTRILGIKTRHFIFKSATLDTL